MTYQQIEERFRHHPPKSEGVVAAHEHFREMFRLLAHEVDGLLPDSREKSLALTDLESALMRTNQCIAFHQVEHDSAQPRESQDSER